MVINSEVDKINKTLKIHGSNEYGDPNFRVVFSKDQTERRMGTFNDYFNKIFIRQVKEVREVEKYPWIKEKWILERWAPGELGHHKDLVTFKNGIYICVYVFQDKEGNYLPPLLKVCEILIKCLLNPVSQSEMITRDENIESKKDELETQEIELSLAIESEESKIKDPDSIRETLSVGYGEENRRIR